MASYDSYVYAIAVLMPISASMLVFQTNPYHALITRGILGAVSALIYTILGAADVALTEALVGSFLATMLYAVAVRSSLVLRLGVVEEIAIAHDLEAEFNKIDNPFTQLEKPSEQLEPIKQSSGTPENLQLSITNFGQLVNALKITFSKYYMRIELVLHEYETYLVKALIDKNVHAILHSSERQEDTDTKFYKIEIRLPRLYEIMQADPALSNIQLTYKKR
jgi:putative multicomponent Na+:H+ antiporter subunit B